MVILAILCPCRLRPKWGSQAVDQEEISKCEEGKWMTIVWFPLGIVEKRHVGVQHASLCSEVSHQVWDLKWVISKTPWPWRTERPPKTCCPGAWRPFWILVKTKRLQPSPHRNTMLLKDGTTSKNMLPRGLTSLLDSGKNKAIAAAEPACCCCCCYCFWNPRKTTFFHSCCCCCCSRMALKEEPSPKYTSCGRNVPSEILQKASCWCGKLL